MLVSQEKSLFELLKNFLEEAEQENDGSFSRLFHTTFFNDEKK
jgi:hypothetical protein